MSYSFKLVEIDPLLCFQFHLEINRSANLYRSIDDEPPYVEDMLPMCLPQQLEAIPYAVVEGRPGRVQIRSESLNLRPMLAGDLSSLIDGNPNQITLAGIALEPASPFVQVVRFDGKCYLKNGVHRAYGLGKAGATHIPCLLLEAKDYSQVARQPRQEIFQRDLLESTNPPTIGHLVQDRAYPVTLRKGFVTVHVKWSYSIDVEAA